jgi:eukaryotic-like serine/threonine-protein kinase
MESKSLFTNIVAAVALLTAIVLAFFFSLDWLTGHGKEEKVPNVAGQNIVAAKKILESKGFDVEVLDSVFVDSIPRLSVVKQAPEADASVKAGRTVYLTINRAIAPEIEMPTLIGYSFKSAQLMLQSLHLKLGDTSSRPDFAKNAVLEQLYNGKIIKGGALIPMGSTISFVLGGGLGSELAVPDLAGLTVAEAMQTIKDLGLGIGPIIARTAIKDTLTSFVVDQSPKVFTEPFPGQKIQNKLRVGNTIDLFIGNAPPIKDTTINNP